jgi:outer membrane protein OmpA-like peptidoglycan-associated protein
VFVLLPDLPGEAGGSISVSNPSGTQELRQPGQAVLVEGPDRAPGATLEMDRTAVERLFGPALAGVSPEPAHFVIYFGPASDGLSLKARATLSDVIRVIRDRGSKDVGIVGHTDTLAPPDYNYRLGLRRARRIADSLVSRGVDRAILDVRSHGESDLAVPTGDDVPEPKNRRVEISVR